MLVLVVGTWWRDIRVCQSVHLEWGTTCQVCFCRISWMLESWFHGGSDGVKILGAVSIQWWRHPWYSALISNIPVEWPWLSPPPLTSRSWPFSEPYSLAFSIGSVRYPTVFLYIPLLLKLSGVSVYQEPWS